MLGHLDRRDGLVGKKDLSATQAKAILATVRPRGVAGKTRRRMAVEELADLVAVDAKLKKTKAELQARSPREDPP